MADDLFPEPSAQESQMVHPNNGRSLKQEDYIAGLAKGLAILDCFDSGQVRLSVTKAAERTGLTRAAARRHLRTLFYLGYLDGDGQQFWLSPKILKPAGIYLNSAALPRAARAVLRSLPKQTGCYHSVVVLSGGEAVTVASCYPPHLEQAQVLPYGIYSGNRIPAHTGANGKVLLAALNPVQLEQWLAAYPLMRFTTQTLTDRSLLQQQLAEVRQQGWAEALGEYEPGFGGLAVPVIDAQGEVVAALNAVETNDHIADVAWRNRCLPLLQKAAAEIRVML